MLTRADVMAILHTARLIVRELASDTLHAGIWAWEKKPPTR